MQGDQGEPVVNALPWPLRAAGEAIAALVFWVGLMTVFGLGVTRLGMLIFGAGALAWCLSRGFSKHRRRSHERSQLEANGSPLQ